MIGGNWRTKRQALDYRKLSAIADKSRSGKSGSSKISSTLTKQSNSAGRRIRRSRSTWIVPNRFRKKNDQPSLEVKKNDQHVNGHRKNGTFSVCVLFEWRPIVVPVSVSVTNKTINCRDNRFSYCSIRRGLYTSHVLFSDALLPCIRINPARPLITQSVPPL